MHKISTTYAYLHANVDSFNCRRCWCWHFAGGDNSLGNDTLHACKQCFWSTMNCGGAFRQILWAMSPKSPMMDAFGPVFHVKPVIISCMCTLLCSGAPCWWSLLVVIMHVVICKLNAVMVVIMHAGGDYACDYMQTKCWKCPPADLSNLETSAAPWTTRRLPPSCSL